VSGGVTRSADRPGLIDRGVYGTIVVTSVLVVYDGWSNLRVSDAVAIILGPVVAIVIGHVFAASVAAYPALERRPTRGELLRIVRRESRFLLVCVPQISLLLILTLAGLGLNDTVRVLIWVGPASLGFWSGVATHRAGLRPRAVALGVILGLAVGGAVLLLQVFLQPGKAVSNGVAEIHPTRGLVTYVQKGGVACWVRSLPHADRRAIVPPTPTLTCASDQEQHTGSPLPRASAPREMQRSRKALATEREAPKGSGGASGFIRFGGCWADGVGIACRVGNRGPKERA
jgi:hypothetical protein